MSTQASLQTPDEVLESPMQETPSKGLIPRSGLFFAIGIFVLALFAFAAYDLMKPPPAEKSKGGDGDKAGTSMAAVKVGPPPAPSDVTEIVRAQGARADEAATRAAIPTTKPLTDEKFSGKVGETNGVDTQVRAALPLPLGMGRSNGSDLDVPPGETARDQRDAAAAISGIFAITGGGGDGLAGAVERSGLPGASGLARSIDPVQRQIDDLTKSLGNSTQTPDPAADISKVLSSLQGNPNAPRPGKDQSWLKEAATEKVAEAAYAKTSASPWMVFQGTRVAIVTREAINSDLPGPVTALSTAPVYDGINQCAVLIPAGTKFIGSYSADIRPGQSRLLLAFRRMIFPDGRSVELDGAQAVDQRGAAGAEGDVNNHFLHMFGYGFAIALLSNATGGGAGVTVTQPNGSSSTTTVAGQVLADIGSRIMSRNSTIPPTITLDVGTRMFVTIVRDIALTPTSRKQCK